MLSIAQEKLIKSLHTKKGREKADRCLVEGAKVIETAGNAVEFTFTEEMSENFLDLITTETPQDVAAVAKIPKWQETDIESRNTIVVLDGVQDPGNVGSILRLCLGFDASIILIESADITSPKVVRSSVGAVFNVPWIKVKRDEAREYIENLGRTVYRIENRKTSVPASQMTGEPAILVVGSEGSGLKLAVGGTSVVIKHSPLLESLNVTHATAIALYERSQK